jgi:peptidoglycan/LPS O-acetylase OafA/YrhL
VPALPAARQRPEVEALRGLAATAVLVSHSWGIGHDYSVEVFSTRWGRLGLAGGGGVALFFALSGYLLTRLLVGTSRPPGLGRYLRHRAARILPTWWFVLAFMLLLHDEGIPARHWWRFPLLVQGFWADTVGRVDGPAWTLALEAQFYLLLPLLAVLLRRSARTAWVTLAVLAVAGTAVNVLTVATGHATTVWRYGLPTNACYFVPGIALAVLEARTDVATRLARLPHPRSVLLALSLPFWLSFVLFPRTSLLTAVAAGLSRCRSARDALCESCAPASWWCSGRCRSAPTSGTSRSSGSPTPTASRSGGRCWSWCCPRRCCWPRRRTCWSSARLSGSATPTGAPGHRTCDGSPQEAPVP